MKLPGRPAVEQSEYDRALELWPPRLLSAATNIDIVPTWIDGEDRFWFRNQTGGGRHEFILVDAASGTTEPAFDHVVVARALDAEPTALPIATFVSEGDSLRITLTDGTTHRVDVTAGTAEQLAADPRPMLESATGSALFLKDFNLWIRDADGTERALTTDGEEFYRWSDLPDGHLTGRIDEHWNAVSRTPQGTWWSDDASVILTSRVDDRKVLPYPYLEGVPRNGSPRPVAHEIRKRLPGEPDYSLTEWWIISPETGAQTRVADLPGDLVIWRLDAWFTSTSSHVFALAASSALDHVALVEIDTTSGAVRIVHEERTESWWDFNTYSHERSQVRYVPERNEFLWYTQRSGWGHIWAIDIANGGLKRQVTDGDWSVWDIAAVTDTHMVFVAGGRESDKHPYHRNWYRVELDGGAPNAGLTLLTDENVDHARRGHARAAVHRGNPLTDEIAPSGRFFVDSMSTIDTAPVIVLRSAEDGTIITELTRSDISGLEALGWRAPEVFTAKSADGDFDMYGIIITPRRFAEQDSWPVVERVYGGNQTPVQPRSFAESLNGAFMYAMYSLAEMGFAVVLVDGPGTPYRSLAFRSYDFHSADRLGMRHHRAAIEQAAAERPWMDISTVGICGHSYGGYSTTMALLLEPDFYKVGHASSAAFDIPLMHGAVIDWHHGWADYGDGRRVKNSEDEWPERYRSQSPSTHVDNLVGRLEIVYGDLDEAAEPGATFTFIDSLTRAGKHYSLVYLPGRNHNHTVEPYHQKRMWDWLVENVQGREPLRHYALPVKAGVRSATM